MMVSIVVPAFDTADVLPRLLTSVEAQTFRDFELLVVDDGSTDGTAELLAQWRSRHAMRVIRQANAGVSVARNVGLDQAQGDAILFADADDVLHPRLLEWTTKALAESKADYVLFGYRKVDESEIAALQTLWNGSGASCPAQPFAEDALSWFAESRRVPSPWQALYSKSSLSERRFIPGIIYEDVPFIIGYLAGAVRGVWLEAELYGYVSRASSQSHAKSLDSWIEGIEAGMRTLQMELNAAQYRTFARTYVARWLMDMYRAAGKSRPDRARVTAFARRALAADLVRWCDFRIGRRLRVLAAVLGASMGKCVS